MAPGRFAQPQHEAEARDSLVALGRLLYERGLIASTDGNFSLRLEADNILLTPAGLAKGRLEPRDLLKVDMEGAVISAEPGRRPSSETPMHLEAYRQRREIRAVIHAHPPHALALTVAGRKLPADVLPELPMTLGEVPTLPFAQPSSHDGARAIRQAIQHHDALLLKNHGCLTVGSDLEAALNALERVEAVAEVIFMAELLGGVERLTAEQLGQLRRARGDDERDPH